jgi:hypothetical protein
MGLRLGVMDMRLIYKEAVEICQKAGVDPKAAGLTDSTLRLEQQLLTTKTQYQFAVLTNNNGPSNTLFNTEVRLNQQDSFISYGLNWYLGEPASATDATFIDYSYPSPTVFVTAGEAAALETIYKSQLKVTINNVVKIPTLHLGRFYFVPQSQKVAAAANQNGIGNDQRDGSTDGGMLMTGLITFIGSKNNLIELFMPAALAAVGPFTRSIQEWRGLLAQNSTIIT